MPLLLAINRCVLALLLLLLLLQLLRLLCLVVQEGRLYGSSQLLVLLVIP
jgi:hypothetical protein